MLLSLIAGGVVGVLAAAAIAPSLVDWPVAARAMMGAACGLAGVVGGWLGWLILALGRRR